MASRKSVIVTFLAIVFCIATIKNANGQTDPFQQLKNVTPQTPQAAGFSKYVDNPVSYFNGLPEISIPIYTIQAGDIKLPINLSYHSGGIKVVEEASWVGLGWALNAGGIISHEIKGIDDDLGNQRFFNKYFANNNANNYSASNADIFFTSTDGLLDINGSMFAPATSWQELGIGAAGVDVEPDLYTYNFNGFSGKFCWINGQVVDVTNNNIKFIRNGSTITARTPDGYSYEFGKTEKTFGGTFSSTLAYYLTQIVSPSGKIVTLEYKSFKQLYDAGSWSSLYENVGISPFTGGDYVIQLPTFFQSVSNSEDPSSWTHSSEPQIGLTINQISSSFNQVQYLDKINFDDGFIKFVHGTRGDLYGAKLNNIEIRRNDNSLYKSINFSYDYFVSTEGGNGIFDANFYPSYVGFKFPYPSNYRKKRLKLTSVAVDDCPYVLEYYEGSNGSTLAFKSSFGQDYWGYANGQSGNSTLVPDFRRYTQNTPLPALLSGYVGADREQNEAKTKEGALKKIRYPTGGTTEFDFELNKYGNLTNEQSVTYTPVTVSTLDAGIGLQQQYFTLPQDTYVSLKGFLFCNNGPDLAGVNDCNCYVTPGCYSSSNAQNGLYVMIEQVHPTTHVAIPGGYLNQWDKYTPVVQSSGGIFTVTNDLLPAGTYRVVANYPDNKAPGILGQKMAGLVVNYFTASPMPPVTEKYCGGLRIKAITNFDPVSSQSTVKNLIYSPGVLMQYPQFYYKSNERFTLHTITSIGLQDIHRYDSQTWIYHYLYSSPVVPYSFSANGSIVGYPTVTEKVSGGELGKTTYSYKVTQDKLVNISSWNEPGTPSTPSLDNGFLLKIQAFDGGNNLLKETLNQQELLLTKTYWPFKYSTHFNSGTIANGNPIVYSNPVDNSIFREHSRFTFYPLQMAKLVTSSTTVKDYANGTNISTSKQFSYNDLGFLKQEVSSSSDGSVLTTNHTYASDYTGVSSGWLQEMKNRNMIGIPLEVVSKRNSLVIGGHFMTYLGHDNIITPNQFYKIRTPSPQAIASTAPNGVLPAEMKLEGTLTYDQSGNLKSSQMASDISKGYLWNSSNTKPVVEAINALSKDVFYTSFEDATGNSTLGDCRTGMKSRTIGFTHVLNGLTNGNYTLTYWKKSGSVWALELVSTTVATGSYTISISGQVDEVRFHPNNSRLTSYTYDDLSGITSINDVNNRSTFYEYDYLGRLALIRDTDRKIVKKISYTCQQPVSTMPSWYPTGTERCKLCPQNSAYTLNIRQIELRDNNVNSSTYNQLMWVDAGIGASCVSPPAIWQNTAAATRCVTANGQNTGFQEQEQIDTNPCSATAGQKRWVSIGANIIACPTCSTSNCSGTNKKCINGVCVTGTYIMMSQVYSNPVCIKTFGYFFPDGSVQFDHTETTYGPCN